MYLALFANVVTWTESETLIGRFLNVEDNRSKRRKADCRMRSLVIMWLSVYVPLAMISMNLQTGHSCTN